MHALVLSALADLESAPVAYTPALRKAYRLALLRSDWPAIYWLGWELDSHEDAVARKRRLAEVSLQYTTDDLKRLHQQTLDAWLSCRTMSVAGDHGKLEDKVMSLSVPEIEATVSGHQEIITRLERLPTGLTPLDTAYFYKDNQANSRTLHLATMQLQKVLARIGDRVYEYLCRLEKALQDPHQVPDVLSYNRRYVGARLTIIAPTVLSELTAADDAAMSGNPDRLSHAATSCRRALKALADVLCPPRSTPSMGADGQERILGEDQYISRLWQFLHESHAGSSAKALAKEQVTSLGKTIDRLNEIASKGIHAAITIDEIHACVITTYTTTGALLRLHEGSSASLQADLSSFAKPSSGA